MKLKTELNELLVDIFHTILKYELKMINYSTKQDLSMREIHLLEIVGKKPKGITISDIAKNFGITLASTTVMAQKLESRNLLIRNRNETDARSNLLTLSQEGKTIDNHHHDFHMNMINKITSGLTELEEAILYEFIKKLNQFFSNEASQLENPKK